MVYNGVFLFDLDESVCGRKLKYKETKNSWFEFGELFGCCSSPVASVTGTCVLLVLTLWLHSHQLEGCVLTDLPEVQI